MTARVRGRYAPSPTGRLHLGNARTALLSWLQIRAQGGAYVMRVEDLDPQRSKAALEGRQLEDLRWLGLDWDEGPDVGGPHGPYRQSERFELYRAALEGLDTYPCTCTRKELREAASAPHGMGGAVYPGTCRDGSCHPERPASTRWRLPEDAAVAFEDRILGPCSQDVSAEVGDFVLLRADHSATGGAPAAWAYQLAVVVDDGAMGITEVLRGADLWASTPRQILLQRALGLPTPRYAHAPLVVGPDGNKLNKRHGAPDLSALREGGEDPRRVVAALARSAGLVGPGVERVSAQELIPDFDLAQVPREPGVLVL
ncbi:Glutamate--tRNA ligase [Plesiocystis pacifica SIR-1]|uniref:Glutamyl-Q tRNA(Asp) synthetase n=1 Tax=Plesiocystis pacifica SIR-1 TaxID=391625 RepID=A6G135_9BACT|nr:tRNA glutamyl-Q(34) synthetase GluQRS [Plesiocystis pacifica]EDM80330.1 Glutamate--tRNA ligase [Plesiocystis pacifica SIR-1]